MEVSIITALISALVTLLVCLINNYVTMNKAAADRKAHDEELQKKYDRNAQETQAMFSQALAIMEVKMDALSKSVDKFYEVIERVYKLERDREVFAEQIKVVNHRLSDLETADKE